MDQVWMSEQFKGLCNAAGLSRVDDFSRHFKMSEIVGKKSVTLCAGQIGDVSVFYKQYDNDPKAFRYVLRWSRARREFESYRAMQRLGVRCATPVACGEARDMLHRLRRSFCITVAIPDARPLPEFVSAHCGWRDGSRGYRSAIISQLAQMTRTAHQGGFVHLDLWVRNVLVNWESPGRPALWWIDSPRGRVTRAFAWLGITMDLAALDKGGAAMFSRAERLRFMLQYMGKDRVDEKVRKMVKRVLDFKERDDQRVRRKKSTADTAVAHANPSEL
jgi:tRNA A-37 threonylcarbamoyl transferase component Bud32